MNKGFVFVAAVIGFISQQVFKRLTEDNRTDREKIRDIHERSRKLNNKIKESLDENEKYQDYMKERGVL